MGAFILPAIGTALNYMNSKAANSRGQDANNAAITNQNNFRNTAVGDVNQTANNIAHSSPTAIANAANTSFVNNLRTNTAANASANGPTSATGAVPGANSRYGAGVAKSTAATQGYGNAQASNMSAMDAAVQQRQNEALQMQTLNTHLNTIGAASQTQQFVDNLRTQAAQQVNPWVKLASGMLTGGGQQLALNSAGTDLPYGSVAANSASGNLGG